MESSTPASLDIRLVPQPVVVQAFWRQWHTHCKDAFGACPKDMECIDRLRKNIDQGTVFIHLHGGLEELLLTHKALHAVDLTAHAWLGLTLLVLNTFAKEHPVDGSNKRLSSAHDAATAALDRARDMFNAVQGGEIEGFSMHAWIAKGPWSHSVASWELLFLHARHLVHPKREPLYWALKELGASMEPGLAAMHCATPAWCLDRPVVPGAVGDVLRMGRHWALREKNTLHDAYQACAASPQWKAVYMLAVWLNREREGMGTTPEEVKTLRAFMDPDHLAYWLALTHDRQHHKHTLHHTVEGLALDKTPHYQPATAMLAGLQLLAEQAQIELAMQAWTRWHQPREYAPLPELH